MTAPAASAAPSTIAVAAIQAAFSDDAEANIARMIGVVTDAAAAGAELILLPELFAGHYFPRRQHPDEFARACPADGHPMIARFQALAAELGVVLPITFFERSGPAYYNSAAIIDGDGALLGIYRKSHIPDGPGYQEKYYFRPGDTGFRAFATRCGTIGVGICWDQWFPEAARAMALAGADVLLYPTAIGSEPDEPDNDTRDPWQRVMIGHAVANQVIVVAANRVGVEGDTTFYGSSFIADPRGDKRAELGRAEEGVIHARFDLAAVRRERANWGFFRDRRCDLYGPLTR